jgi:hypothetical protein
MSRVPIFIEVAKAGEAQLCRAVVDVLLEQGMAPIGMATSMTELTEILTAIKENALEPAIFIINTFESKEILPQLDALMGDKPAVFLRRGMYAGQSGLMDQLVADDPNKMNTMAVLKKLTPRLTAIWTYGAKNAAQVTQRMIQCMQRYQADGDFRHFEIAAKLGS